MLPGPTIPAFVALANQFNPPDRRKLRCEGLIQLAALRRKHNPRLLRAATGALRLRRQTAKRLQTFKDRFRLQDHSFAAAKWAVIHGAVFIFRKVPQVVNVYFDQARFASPPNNSVIQWAAKEVGKD